MLTGQEIIDRDIRRCNWAYPEGVNELHLTKQEHYILYCVKSMGYSESKVIAAHMNKSIPHISNILRSLVNKGYIIGTQCKDPTGGMYYEYKAVGYL